MASKSSFTIESRVQLASALAEAAEVEHNLMCLYLYAMFSLKRSVDEEVSEKELQAIEKWRKTILGVALEEMAHLTLVSNLTTACGGSPSFMRPNFPSSPGLYPAGIVIELAPFDLSTLEHFIFLERPSHRKVEDGSSFVNKQNYTRVSPKARLMPTSGDYETVGALYESIREALISLSERLGEKKLFCESVRRQIGPLDSPLPGLTAVSGLDDALRAIDTIVAQGEGDADGENSHFRRFCVIEEEYRELLGANPNFRPGREVARNPVMRKPIIAENRVWVTDELSSRYLDIANALYNLMLRTLVQIYAFDDRPRDSKATLLESSYSLMHAMGVVAETLTLLPCGSENAKTCAGMSFAMVRSLSPIGRVAEKGLLLERYGEFLENLKRLQVMLDEKRVVTPSLKACAESLKRTSAELSVVREKLEKMPEMAETTLAIPVPQKSIETTASRTSVPEPSANSGVEVSETKAIRLLFEAKRCIHSRYCVTELPEVFKANTPGEWIFAGKAVPEHLAAVARECPSGAIRYVRKDDAPQEPLPAVNIMRTRENGPYAFLAPLTIDGKNIGIRATLCRCGKSANKPFCDGSHNAVKFVATGEPATLDATELSSRGGPLTINRLNNGPLSVEGNVEICAGTGRVVLRTQKTRLCRCGHSNNKPLCDNSHVAAGFTDSISEESK